MLTTGLLDISPLDKTEEGEEDEDGEKEEGKGTATRANTRLASRLEAER